MARVHITKPGSIYPAQVVKQTLNGKYKILKPSCVAQKLKGH